MASITSFNRFPKQRLSKDEKLADDMEWAKMCIDSAVNYYMSEFIGSRGKKSEVQNMLANYRIYNSEINQEDWGQEMNILGLDAEFDDEIQPYNEAYNKINVLLGEEGARPINFKIIRTSEAGLLSVLREKERKLNEYINGLVEIEKQKERMRLLKEIPQPNRAEIDNLKQQIEEQVNQLMPPEKIQKYLDDYQDNVEIASARILKYLRFKENLYDKKVDGLKHGLISNLEACYVGIKRGEPFVKQLNSPNVIYYKDADTKKIEEGLFAGYISYMHPANVIDEYRDELTDEQINKLEEGLVAPKEDTPKASMNYKIDRVDYRYRLDTPVEHGQYDKHSYDTVEVVHLEWRSEKKVGFLRYWDEDGNIQITVVPEYYKLRPELGDIEIEWEWVPEIWEATRIANDIYVKVQPKEQYQFDIERPFAQPKLGYHGVVYNNTNAQSVSLMDRMKPYLLLYMFTMNKMKEMIGDDLGMLLAMDTSMITDKMGTKKFLYFMKKMKTIFYNSLYNSEDPNSTAPQRSRTAEAVNLSNVTNIANYTTILEYIERKIGAAAGIPDHREGGTSSYDAVSNVQQNIIQSSHITRIYIHAHNEHWKSVLGSLLNVAQIAYHNNPRDIMWMDGTTRAVVKRSEVMEFCNEQLGLFVTDNPKELEIIENLRQLAVPIIQNEVQNVNKLIKILKSESVAEMEREIEELERMEAQRNQQFEEKQLQLQKEQYQRDIENREDVQEHDKDKIKLKGEYDLQKAIIQALGFDTDKDRNANDMPDVLEIGKLMLEGDELRFQRSVKEKELAQGDRKLDIEEKKVNAQRSKQ